MNFSRTLLVTSFATLLTVSAHAGKNADLQPNLAKAGKSITEQTFDSGDLAKPWTVAKGDWKIADGAIVGAEKAEDKHAAVLALAQPNHDSLIRFSLQLDGAKSFALSLNHAKGHLFRVAITKDSISINKDRDKNDPQSKGGVLGKADAKFEPGQWVTLLVEIKGTKVAVQTDTGAKAEGSDPSLDVEKTGYRFVTTGASVRIDDLKVWSAE